MRSRAGIGRELASRVEQRVLSWLDTWRELISTVYMVSSVLTSDVSGGRVRGRPRFGWMDGVQAALCSRGI